MGNGGCSAVHRGSVDHFSTHGDAWHADCGWLSALSSRLMTRRTIQLVALLILLGMERDTARADGGQVRAVRRQDNYQMTVFTSPMQPRVGPVDISVALQDLNTGEIVRDSQIKIELTPRLPSNSAIHTLATDESATNKLLKSALVDLPTDGLWKVTVSVGATALGVPIEAEFEMEVTPSSPAWISVWPWFSWPVIPIALFGIHRNFVAKRRCVSGRVHNV